MTTWRVIVTDTYGLTGVAPTCPDQDDYTKHSTGDGYMKEPADASGVYDCCPWPQIECWSPDDAAAVAERLTSAGAEACQ